MKPTLAPPTLQQRLAERTRPDGTVVMHQRWEQLLFLHWRWDRDAVQATLPPGLHVDTYENAAWLGVVPLFMRDVRPRFLPATPVLSDFLELNVRTYVHDERGRPGLYFYSLDCNQPLAVEGARLMHLRYEHAAMQATVGEDGMVDFTCQRTGTEEQARFRYQLTGGPEPAAAPESFDFFLLERYRLFASDNAGEQLSTIRVSHPPYLPRVPLVLEWSAVPLRLAGFDPDDRAPDHYRAVEPQNVEVFAPEKV